jgi:hypothetical protein
VVAQTNIPNYPVMRLNLEPQIREKVLEDGAKIHAGRSLA